MIETNRALHEVGLWRPAARFIVRHAHSNTGGNVSLRHFTLIHDDDADKWKLVNDQTNRTVRAFETKGDATAGGVLKSALGEEGGSVKIQLENGRYEEERTYPRSADPRRSKG